MMIQSTRFGEIDVAQEHILSFPMGLPGFPEEKQFVFLAQGKGSPFAFLQSTLSPDLAFVIVEPFSFFNDYTFTLPDEYVNDLGLSEDNLPQILNLVTIKASLESATVNLAAPIIVNWQDQTAMQVILEKTPYTTRHKLFPNGLNKTAEGGR